MNLDKIEEAILSNSTLKTLRTDLNKLNFNLSLNKQGEKETYIKALKYWNKIRKTRHPLIEKDIETLPITVKNDSTLIKIYGIIHNENAYQINKFVNEIAKKYHNQPKTEIFYEEYFDDFFKINYGVDLKDHTSISFKNQIMGYLFQQERALYIEILKNSTNKSLLNKALDGVCKLFPEFEYDEEVELLLNSKKNLKYLVLNKELHIRTHLPEPLYMDYISDTFAKYVTERSLHMSRIIKNFEEKFEEIHVLVGLTHASQIEYFIKSNFGKKSICPTDLSFYD